jgi:hypothetical protein
MSKSTDIPEFNFDALADFQCGENRKEGPSPPRANTTFELPGHDDHHCAAVLQSAEKVVPVI